MASPLNALHIKASDLFKIQVIQQTAPCQSGAVNTKKAIYGWKLDRWCDGHEHPQIAFGPNAMGFGDIGNQHIPLVGG